MKKEFESDNPTVRELMRKQVRFRKKMGEEDAKKLQRQSDGCVLFPHESLD